MIEILLVILLIAWLGGWRMYPQSGNGIHLLLVIFVVLLILRLLNII